jgi:hypothetical protein
MGILPVLRHYFAEELRTAWVFVVVAGLALAAGAWLWKVNSAFKHALWPLGAVALIQLAVGGALIVRTPTQVAMLEQGLSQDPAATQAAESLRLTKVLDAFRVYKLFEIALLLTAIGLALFLPQHPVARGVALGLLLQSAALLAADLVAEHRAEAYLDALRRS